MTRGWREHRPFDLIGEHSEVQLRLFIRQVVFPGITPGDGSLDSPECGSRNSARAPAALQKIGSTLS